MGTTQGEPTLLTHWSLLGLTQGMTSRGQQDAYFHPPSTSQVATELPVVKTAPAPHLSVHEKLRFPNLLHTCQQFLDAVKLSTIHTGHLTDESNLLTIPLSQLDI